MVMFANNANSGTRTLSVRGKSRVSDLNRSNLDHFQLDINNSFDIVDIIILDIIVVVHYFQLILDVISNGYRTPQARLLFPHSPTANHDAVHSLCPLRADRNILRLPDKPTPTVPTRNGLPTPRLRVDAAAEGLRGQSRVGSLGARSGALWRGWQQV
jgi:hypothetical protein